MYSDAKYVKGFNDLPICISVKIGDQYWAIPLDPANSDYAAIMALVAEGKLTIGAAQ
jgi:hypothetical protein